MLLLLLFGQVFAEPDQENRYELDAGRPVFLVLPDDMQKEISDKEIYVSVKPDAEPVEFQIVKDGANRNKFYVGVYKGGTFTLDIIMPQHTVKVEDPEAESTILKVHQIILVVKQPVPPVPPKPVPPKPKPEPEPEPGDKWGKFQKELKEAYEKVGADRYIDCDVVQGDGHVTKKKAHLIVADCYEMAAAEGGDVQEMLNTFKNQLLDEMPLTVIANGKPWQQFLSKGAPDAFNNLELTKGDNAGFKKAMGIAESVVREESKEIADITAMIPPNIFAGTHTGEPIRTVSRVYTNNSTGCNT